MKTKTFDLKWIALAAALAFGGAALAAGGAAGGGAGAGGSAGSAGAGAGAGTGAAGPSGKGMTQQTMSQTQVRAALKAQEQVRTREQLKVQ